MLSQMYYIMYNIYSMLSQCITLCMLGVIYVCAGVCMCVRICAGVRMCVRICAGIQT
jgi:hypothetical protein